MEKEGSWLFPGKLLNLEKDDILKTRFWRIPGFGMGFVYNSQEFAGHAK